MDTDITQSFNTNKTKALNNQVNLKTSIKPVLPKSYIKNQTNNSIISTNTSKKKAIQILFKILYIIFLPIIIIFNVTKYVINKLSLLIAKRRIHDSIKLANYEEIINTPKKQLSEEAYTTLFNTTSAKKIFENIPELQNSNKTSLEQRDILSATYLDDAKQKVGVTNPEEDEIINRITSLPQAKLLHYTDYNLVTNDTMQIYSRDLIRSKGINSKLHRCNRGSASSNIPCNNDSKFISFSVEFTDTDITNAPIIKKNGSTCYGKTCYVIPEEFAAEYGYFTLIDLYCFRIQTSNRPPATEVFSKHDINWILEYILETPCIESKKLNGNAIVAIKDMRELMAYYTVLRLRKLDNQIAHGKPPNDYLVSKKQTTKDKKITQDEQQLFIKERNIFVDLLLHGDLNSLTKILNTIFNPTIQIPQVVIAKKGEYAKHEIKNFL